MDSEVICLDSDEEEMPQKVRNCEKFQFGGNLIQLCYCCYFRMDLWKMQSHQYKKHLQLSLK